MKETADRFAVIDLELKINQLKNYVKDINLAQQEKLKINPDHKHLQNYISQTVKIPEKNLKNLTSDIYVTADEGEHDKLIKQIRKYDDDLYVSTSTCLDS